MASIDANINVHTGKVGLKKPGPYKKKDTIQPLLAFFLTICRNFCYLRYTKTSYQLLVFFITDIKLPQTPQKAAGTSLKLMTNAMDQLSTPTSYFIQVIELLCLVGSLATIEIEHFKIEIESLVLCQITDPSQLHAEKHYTS